MRTAMVLDALDMARHSRATNLEGLVAHSDAGSQGGFKRSWQHLEMEVVRHVQARACGGGSTDARQDLVSGSPVDSDTGAQGRVLEGHRAWDDE
jgi:hypothetical protein